MQSDKHPTARLLTAPILWLGTFLAALCAYFILQYARGIDTNWDLQNYHLSDWILWRRGSYFDNVAPSGIQSYFSPFVNGVAAVPLELLGVRIGGIAIAAIHASMMAFTVVLLTRTSISKEPHLRAFDKIAIAVAVIALAVTAPMPLGTLGTSFADTSLALLLALAVLETLRIGLTPNNSRGFRVAFILSICVALKATTLPFAIGHGVSLYVTMIATAQRPGLVFREAFVFAVSSLVLTGILAGGWMWQVYVDTGNPLFPFANTLFRSPLTYLADMSDIRFVPQSLRQFLSYPLAMARGTANVSEVQFTDARYLILIVVVILLAGFAAIAISRRARTTPGWTVPGRLDAFTWFLIGDFVLALLIWRITSSGQRFLVFADVLLAVLLVRIVAAFPQRWVTPGLIAVVAAHLSTVTFPDWGHRPIRQTPTSAVIADPPFLDDALVILGEKPMAHIVGWFGAHSRFVLAQAGAPRVDIDTRASGPFAPRVRALIERPFPNGIWVVLREKSPGFPLSYLKEYNLTATSQCRDLRTFVEDFKVCKVEKL